MQQNSRQGGTYPKVGLDELGGLFQLNDSVLLGFYLSCLFSYSCRMLMLASGIDEIWDYRDLTQIRYINFQSLWWSTVFIINSLTVINNLNSLLLFLFIINHGVLFYFSKDLAILRMEKCITEKTSKTQAILASNGDNLPAARALNALSHILFSFNNYIFLNNALAF